MGLLKKKPKYEEVKAEPAKANMSEEGKQEEPQQPQQEKISVGDLNRNEALLFQEMQVIQAGVEATLVEVQQLKKLILDNI